MNIMKKNINQLVCINYDACIYIHALFLLYHFVCSNYVYFDGQKRKPYYWHWWLMMSTFEANLWKGYICIILCALPQIKPKIN